MLDIYFLDKVRKKTITDSSNVFAVHGAKHKTYISLCFLILELLLLC